MYTQPALQASHPHAVAELRSMATRSLVYVILSLVCYIPIWIAAIRRPLDLQLDVVSENVSCGPPDNLLNEMETPDSHLGPRITT